ncbi:UNVERIFIED_CONTAM: hypothetical protein K2H54_021052, partial [Gekko kuhli]
MKAARPVPQPPGFAILQRPALLQKELDDGGNAASLQSPVGTFHTLPDPQAQLDQAGVACKQPAQE